MSIIASKADIIPYRVHFNFEDRCNMNCDFCYVTFKGRTSQSSIWSMIIDRIATLAIPALTFGGGDPFKYKAFRDLLLYSFREKNLKRIHVDTNGLGMNSLDYELVTSSCESIGLPLDGASPLTHAAMRGHDKHHEIVIRHIKELAGNDFHVRVNTVVTNINKHEMENLADILENCGARSWSLYQFWPTSPTASRFNQKHGISNDCFNEIARRLHRRQGKLKINTQSINNRIKPYFFVDDSGQCYTLSPNGYMGYSDLGSIFSDDILLEWERIAQPTRFEQGWMNKGGHIKPVDLKRGW